MTDKEERFKTHIKEPRWQQVVSVVVVLVVFGLELYFLLHH
jgi:hypothetical protein